MFFQLSSSASFQNVLLSSSVIWQAISVLWRKITFSQYTNVFFDASTHLYSLRGCVCWSIDPSVPSAVCKQFLLSSQTLIECNRWYISRPQIDHQYSLRTQTTPPTLLHRRFGTRTHRCSFWNLFCNLKSDRYFHPKEVLPSCQNCRHLNVAPWGFHEASELSFF